MAEDSRQVGALDEIEITPEMIEAGALELSRFNEEFAPLNEGVEKIVWAVLEKAGFRITGSPLLYPSHRA